MNTNTTHPTTKESVMFTVGQSYRFTFPRGGFTRIGTVIAVERGWARVDFEFIGELAHEYGRFMWIDGHLAQAMSAEPVDDVTYEESCNASDRELLGKGFKTQPVVREFQDEDDESDTTGESAVDWWMDAPELNARYTAGALLAQPISGDATTIELGGF
jgi:hypothetical protein